MLNKKHLKNSTILVFFSVVFLILPSQAVSEFIEIQSEKHLVQAIVLHEGLNHPWGMAFLPEDKMLVTERPGRLLLLSKDGTQSETVSGLPEIAVHGQGGLLDVAIHPNFSSNSWVYLSYAGRGKGGVGTEVGRAKLNGTNLEDWQVLFKLQPKTGKPYHFGSRLVFDGKGHLFITLGDRGSKQRAQKINDHAGSVIRLHDDGRVPVDNPFPDQDGKPSAVYSYGHRNAQGAFLHPETEELWLHEHGPQGGDELNISRAGKNYGWPAITYGVNYGSGTTIGEGTAKAGMEQPLYYWVPSIAPSGMAYYSGKVFKKWKGNLLVGSLKFRLLARLEMSGEKVIHEERLLQGVFGRVRDVREGPDGLIYLLTDSDNGQLIRLQPDTAM